MDKQLRKTTFKPIDEEVTLGVCSGIALKLTLLTGSHNPLRQTMTSSVPNDKPGWLSFGGGGVRK